MMNVSHLLMIVLSLTSTSIIQASTLSDNTEIASKLLNYNIQYRVYSPDTLIQKKLPTLFVTDGQWFLDQGKMVEKLDRLISEGKIPPIFVVFVDSRNPNNLNQNRRNSEFWCNQRYAAFYKQELLPALAIQFEITLLASERGIMGLSFGGLNAGCFGLMVSDTFQLIGMLSPANDKHLKILVQAYKDNPTNVKRFFLSAGTKKDNIKAVRNLHQALLQKKYFVQYIEVPFGHNWSNWEPLIEDLLTTLYPKVEGKI